MIGFNERSFHFLLANQRDSPASKLGVDRYVFFRCRYRYRLLQIKQTDNRYFEPIYVSGVKMKMNAKINNNKSSDKKTFFKCF